MCPLYNMRMTDVTPCICFAKDATVLRTCAVNAYDRLILQSNPNPHNSVALLACLAPQSQCAVRLVVMRDCAYRSEPGVRACTSMLHPAARF